MYARASAKYFEKDFFCGKSLAYAISTNTNPGISSSKKISPFHPAVGSSSLT
jgi:hypothetical protein